MIKNKRGEEEEGLAANTIGVVLAVIATAIIVFFIYVAITQIMRDEELESAQVVADKLEEKINALEAGQSTKVALQGSKALNDGEWYILGWGKQNADRPDKCFFNGCVCLCKGTDADACQKKGVCREIEKDTIITLYYYYTHFDPVPEETTAPDPFLDSQKQIPIPPNFLILEVTNTADKLTISYKSEEYLQNGGR
ncbi:MAG: hypothetical protein ABH864_07390 [archaeon]